MLLLFHRIIQKGLAKFHATATTRIDFDSTKQAKNQNVKLKSETF